MERPSRMRKSLAARCVFWVLMGFVWLAVLAIACEVGEVAYVALTRPLIEAFAMQRIGDGIKAWQSWKQDTAAEAPTLPPGLSPPPDAPSRSAFFEKPDAASRQALAATRQEVVLLCGNDGKILERYAATEPASLASLTQAAQPGAAFSSAFQCDPQIQKDAVQAFQLCVGGSPEPWREYPCPLADGSQYVVECRFVAEPKSAAPGARCAVFLRESLYETLWYAMRPHKYRNDLFSEWTVWTNNLGFRDEERAAAKPPKTYRILCLGGSTTFEGPRNDLTYPLLVQRKLRDYFRTSRIEVFNCGVNAMNSNGIRRRLPELLALHPDLIVYYNFANDTNMIVSKTYERENRRTGFPAQLRWLLRKSLFCMHHAAGWIIPDRERFMEVIEETSNRNLEALCDMAKEQGVRVALCSFGCPEVQRMSGWERRYFEALSNRFVSIYPEMQSYARANDADNRLIRRLCAERGAIYVPVAEELDGVKGLFIDNCHLYPEGIRRKSEIVFRGLRDSIAQDVRQATGE